MTATRTRTRRSVNAEADEKITPENSESTAAESTDASTDGSVAIPSRDSVTNDGEAVTEGEPVAVLTDEVSPTVAAVEAADSDDPVPAKKARTVRAKLRRGNVVADTDSAVEPAAASDQTSEVAEASAATNVSTIDVTETAEAVSVEGDSQTEAPAKPKRASRSRAKSVASDPEPAVAASDAMPDRAGASDSQPSSGMATDGASEETTAESADEEPNTTFEDLGLTGALLTSLKSVGYEAPTPIQEATIPDLLAGRDVIAQAQTGSGKTAAFGLPVIEMIDPKDRRVQALILCPTRELAIQVAEALHKYGRHKQVETLPIYGGQAYERQFRGLQRGVQIVVGTPGRVMDHMRRGSLNLDAARFFILDEADEMLDMGFIDDVDWVLGQVPSDRQMALFSATMPPRIAELARAHMHDPARITVRGREMTVTTTTQTAYEVPRSRKLDALNRILDAEEPQSVMVFCRTKNGVDELGEALQARGYAVETLHGDLSQAQRDRVMRRFRGGQAEILIATDVAARGLDIPDVSHVINFDIPESTEAYVHRIGRTGRAGREGAAITLVSPRELRWLRLIERATKGRIDVRRLPTLADVADRRREAMKNQIMETVKDEGSYEPYLELVEELTEDADMSAVAAAVIKLFADETGRGAITNPKEDDLATFGTAQRGRSEQGMTRLFLSIGRAQGIRPQDIVGAIANEAGIPGRSIGAIDILDSSTFVDVPTGSVEAVLQAMQTTRLKGRPVHAEVSNEAPRTGERGFGGDRRERGGHDFGDRRGGVGGDRGPRPFRDRPDRGGPRGGFNDRPDRGPRDNRGPRDGRFGSDGGHAGDREPRRFDRNERGPRHDDRELERSAGPRRFERDGDRGDRFTDRPWPARNQEPYRPFQRGPRDDGE